MAFHFFDQGNRALFWKRIQIPEEPNDEFCRIPSTKLNLHQASITGQTQKTRERMSIHLKLFSNTTDLFGFH